MQEFFGPEGTLAEGWAAAAILLLLWSGAGLLAVRWTIGRLRGFLERTKSGAGGRLIGFLSLPLQVLVVLTGLWASVRLTPIFPDYAGSIARWGKIVLLLGGIFLVDSALQGILKFLENGREEIRKSHFMFSAVLHLMVWGIGLMMVLDGLGVSITPLLASLGVGSLAVALALQNTLSNFFSGLYLMLDKPVKVGQFVKLPSGEEGYVEEIGWRSTRIRMLPNNTVILPNASLAESRILNFHLPDSECAVLVQVGVDYASDLSHVEKVTVEVAREVQRTVEGGVAGFDPFIRYHTFAESSINFTVILRAKEFVDNYLLQHEFIKRLHGAFKKEGITIPFPQRTLELREGPTLGAWTQSPPGGKL